MRRKTTSKVQGISLHWNRQPFYELNNIADSFRNELRRENYLVLKSPNSDFENFKIWRLDISEGGVNKRVKSVDALKTNRFPNWYVQRIMNAPKGSKIFKEMFAKRLTRSQSAERSRFDVPRMKSAMNLTFVARSTKRNSFPLRGGLSPVSPLVWQYYRITQRWHNALLNNTVTLPPRNFIS